MQPIVKVHRRPGARLPQRATEGAAALDVYACLDPDTYLALSPGDRISVPTGLSFQIPEGYFLSLRPRSGLALKHGITLPNSPATIDSDYRGELLVILQNLGHQEFRVQHGDRIAQILLEKVLPFAWEEVETRNELDPTERGEGGFGSTGLGATGDAMLA